MLSRFPLEEPLMRILSLAVAAAFAAPVAAQMAFVEVPGSASGAGGMRGRSTYDSHRNRIVAVTEAPGSWLGSPTYMTAEEWDGNTWTTSASQAVVFAGSLRGFCYDEASQRCVLSFATGVPIEWNGTNWINLPPTPMPISETCFDPVRQKVVGLMDANGSAQLASWDGSQWSAESVSPGPFSALAELVYDVAHTRIIAVPKDANPLVGSTVAWELHGASWVQLPPPPGLVWQPVYDHVANDVLFVSGSVRLAGSQWIAEPMQGAAGTNGTAPLVPMQRICSTPAGGIYWVRSPLYEAVRYPQAPLASVTQFGHGCPGPLGIPSLIASSGPPGQSTTVYDRPVLGDQFYMTMTNIPPYGLAYPYMMVSFSNQSLAGVPLPWDLANFGMPGCELQNSVEYLLLQRDVDFTIPARIEFAGVHIYYQGMALNLLGPNGPHASFTPGYDCMFGLPH
jgi:hypothetical protein